MPNEECEYLPLGSSYSTQFYYSSLHTVSNRIRCWNGNAAQSTPLLLLLLLKSHSASHPAQVHLFLTNGSTDCHLGGALYEPHLTRSLLSLQLTTVSRAARRLITAVHIDKLMAVYIAMTYCCCVPPSGTVQVVSNWIVMQNDDCDALYIMYSTLL